MKLRQPFIWGGGFLCSCLFIWAVSALFSDGIVPVELDDRLGVFVHNEDSVIRFRSEGWSDTRIGKHGLTVAGEAALKNPHPKFILWGDSFAAAVQMEDSLRAANVYNALSGTMSAFTVASGGLGVPDYFFNIPRYEKLSESIVGHVILLAGLGDIMPGRYSGCHSRFLTDPWRFEESACEPSQFALQYAHFASRWRLEPFYKLYRFMKEYTLRLAPGQVAGGESVQTKNLPYDRDEAWLFLVESLKAQTSGFLVFVYVPPVPLLRGGRVVSVNPEAASKERFKELCVAQGVGFVDLSQSYRDLYYEEGRLPSGFFNSPPGGHINEDGQRLIAEGVYEYFKEAGL